MMSRHDLLARDRAQARREHRLAQQEEMTPDEVHAAMKRAINEALDEREAVTRDDMIRANIPAEELDRRFRTVMAEVVAERRKAGIR